MTIFQKLVQNILQNNTLKKRQFKVPGRNKILDLVLDTENFWVKAATPLIYAESNANWSISVNRKFLKVRFQALTMRHSLCLWFFRVFSAFFVIYSHSKIRLSIKLYKWKWTSWKWNFKIIMKNLQIRRFYIFPDSSGHKFVLMNRFWCLF